MIKKFKIINLECGACVKLSTAALKKITGVQDVKINLETGATEIESINEIDWQEIVNKLKAVNKVAER